MLARVATSRAGRGAGRARSALALAAPRLARLARRRRDRRRDPRAISLFVSCARSRRSPRCSARSPARSRATATATSRSRSPGARDDELGDLVARTTRSATRCATSARRLVHRELLLDTMVQNTPVAMLLVRSGRPRRLRQHRGAPAARRAAAASRARCSPTCSTSAPEPLREAVARGGDGLFVVERDGEEDIYYLARSGFRLNGRRTSCSCCATSPPSCTARRSRTWKKVIRVISHELNNSLAPIASLAHSGRRARQARQVRPARQGVRDDRRARAATSSSSSSATREFAKLPAPRPEAIAWADFVERLRSADRVPASTARCPTRPARFDPAQLEQALVNLLRNAHESGSAGRRRPAAAAQAAERASRSRSATAAPGMSEAVLSNALLPFYSTKRGGTGLGLALVARDRRGARRPRRAREPRRRRPRRHDHGSRLVLRLGSLSRSSVPRCVAVQRVGQIRRSSCAAAGRAPGRSSTASSPRARARA